MDGITIEHGNCGPDCSIPEEYYQNLTTYIGDAGKGTTKTFLVKCEGKCRDIAATVDVDSGDPDIYASEQQPPQIGKKELFFFNYFCFQSYQRKSAPFQDVVAG